MEKIIKKTNNIYLIPTIFNTIIFIPLFFIIEFYITPSQVITKFVKNLFFAGFGIPFLFYLMSLGVFLQNILTIYIFKNKRRIEINFLSESIKVQNEEYTFSNIKKIEFDSTMLLFFFPFNIIFNKSKIVSIRINGYNEEIKFLILKEDEIKNIVQRIPNEKIEFE